jgi:alkanesulfonate monooxygenase SsuD/methylene tetrahydromethanopterin reductase-like flavin-dependent oxidoreductase (luciferase family)
MRRLLHDEPWPRALEALQALPPQQAVNPLISFFCSGEALLRWRAVTGLGVVTAHLAVRRMEAARVVMRRLMWTLNDESGGIGWGAPEAMGEIMARHAGLAAEYANLLIAYLNPDGNFLEHPMLQRGLLWGVGRLAHARPEAATGAAVFLPPFLISPDACHRGLAAWSLRAIPGRDCDALLSPLTPDAGQLDFYREGQIYRCTVADLATGGLGLPRPSNGPTF